MSLLKIYEPTKLLSAKSPILFFVYFLLNTSRERVETIRAAVSRPGRELSHCGRAGQQVVRVLSKVINDISIASVFDTVGVAPGPGAEGGGLRVGSRSSHLGRPGFRRRSLTKIRLISPPMIYNIITDNYRPVRNDRQLTPASGPAPILLPPPYLSNILRFSLINLYPIFIAASRADICPQHRF